MRSIWDSERVAEAVGKVTQSQNALNPRGMTYSPTNGTRSNGQLIWRSGFGTMTNQ